MIVREIKDCRLHVVAPADAHTLEGFRSWANSPDFPEYGRISLIQGEVLVDMTPERLGSHNKVKTHITSVLSAWVDSLDSGDVFGEGVWLTNGDAGLSTEPDATFVSNEAWKLGRVEIVARENEDDGIELRGTPDWILEIVSPSSIHKDTQLLLEAYHQAGVSEYWLVGVRNEPLRFNIYVHHPDGYVASESQDGWQTSPVFNRQFRLECQRRGVGRWRYHLHQREIPTS